MSREVGMKFVQSVASNDFKHLAELFTENIVFTAASPGDTWHGEGLQDTLTELRDFFSPDEVITKIVSVEHQELPGRSRISYRLQGNEKELGSFEYEHQAYYQMEINRISRLRVLCSGLYKPEE
jgi:hypothetical protein